MKFDYKNFVEGLQKEFNGTFDVLEIKELLNLDEEINKDTPLSTGKRLEINYVSFTGKKATEENLEFANDIINYEQEIYSGVNIWVADNLKGKSSIFKIIKFALTGDNKLKPNISKWIEHILVIFSINEKKYTVYINNSKRQISAALYNKEVRSFPTDEEYVEERLFLATTKEDFKDQLQNFFFRQFDYYSLRWTQKSPVKDSDELMDVGASWVTYFKSIFLESKDSTELMFGSQGTKIFQMLLGLHLTSPINKLTVQKDMLLHQKGKQQSYDSRATTEKNDERAELEKELHELKGKLDEIIRNEGGTIDIAPLVKQYDDLLKEIEAEDAKSFKINNDTRENRDQKGKLVERKQTIEEDLRKLNKELHKAEKQRIDIKEYIEIGVLFSNLDITTCPSCSHPVTNEKKQRAVNAHACALCNDDVSQDVSEVNTDGLIAKADALTLLQENIKLSIEARSSELEEIRKNDNELYSTTVKLEQQRSSIKDIDTLNKKLLELGKTINEERQKVRPRDSEKNKLIEQKAVLNFRINQLDELPKKSGDEKIEQKIQLLTTAIEELNKIRFAEGQSILKKLSDLMTNEVKALGLRISEITIGDRFEVKYKQDGDYLSFSEIAEGEQLRAKIAFYLSLIQLDIEHNHGRHCRFLIIDSPGKEEGDNNYLNGLTALIKELETRFGDQLQILIGTAERTLENTVKHQNVLPADTYVF
ncbi:MULTISPECIES: hypothetical protein [unclassified Chryseobacterium]|uniref:hypothetical protein n=1 Tax=unclassified Chryseobacterium TaxID=2593645 RepID=UPI000D377E4D|nr:MULTISPECIES: hypothetical protein [unclassified Chryseobacterium]PTT67358.1 hypothetical protein DBR25_21285 [Chryseobacterium sp. HMWF001]PVV56552.1 hypothetical protein DD829_10680 [Chryseobacterium sp. HMWF035]